MQIENKKAETLTIANIEKVIYDKSLELKDNVLHNFANELQKKDRVLSIATAIERAKPMIDKLEYRVSGKELISSLSRWTQENFQVSLSPIKLAQNMKAADISDELTHVISAIEKSGTL